MSTVKIGQIEFSTLCGQQLYKAHPWLLRKMTRVVDERVEEYGNGAYYDDILPEYIFNKKVDTDILVEWLKEKTSNGEKPFNHILELNCGTGRATKLLLPYSERITCIDISESMLVKAKQNVEPSANVRHIDFIRCDAIDFVMDKNNREFLSSVDCIISFWGIFYPTNDLYLCYDLNGELISNLSSEVESNAKLRLIKFIDSLPKKARFLFFHVRSDTEEQLIYRPLWGLFHPEFMPPKPTPSERLLKLALETVEASYTWDNVGGYVRYEGLEEALEAYLNFHLKGYFNNKPELPYVYSYTSSQLCKRQTKDGIELEAGYIHIEGTI